MDRVDFSNRKELIPENSNQLYHSRSEYEGYWIDFLFSTGEKEFFKNLEFKKS
jgi:hypothetical protein